MRIHNPSITGSLSISGSGLSIDGVGTFSGSVTSTGSFGRVIANSMLVDSGSLLVSGSTPNVYEDGLVKIKQGGQGPGLFVEGGRDANLRLRSTSYRGGIFIDEPGTNTTMGSALVLPGDNTFRLGTNAHYHMTMYSDTGLTTILSDGVDTIILDTDQNAEFAGNVSGSSTSTGSFGYLEIADSGGSPTIHLNEPAGGGGDSAVRMTEDGGFRGGFIKYDGGNNVIKIGTHANNNRTVSDDITAIQITRNDGFPFFITDEVYFRQSLIHEGDTDTFIKYTTNNIDLSAGGNVFAVTTTSISGSSTSTGSFGVLKVGPRATAGMAFQVSKGNNDFIKVNSTNALEPILQFGDIEALGNSGIFTIDGANSKYTFTEYNVGIGNSSPTSTLTVEGNISGSGTLTLGKYTAGSHVIIKTSADEKGISIQNTANASALRSLEMYIDANGKGCIRKTSASGLDNDLFIQPNHGDVHFPGSGDVIFANTLSGSFTSTGSFGDGRFTGKVGIGDTTPAAKLVVVGDVSIGSTSNGLYFGNTSGVGYIQGTDTEGSAYNALGFKTSGNYAIYIDTSDRVGIGTTTPFSPVQIKTSSDPTSLPIASQNHLGLGGVGTSNGIVSIGFGYAGATTSYRPAQITYKNTQNGGNQAGELGFWTRNTTNGGDRPLERLRIEDGGDILFHPTGSGLKVGIGTTAPGSTLTVVGDISGSGNFYLKNNQALWMGSAAGAPSHNALFTDTSDMLIMRTNNTLAVAIEDNNQAVGIGVVPETDWRSTNVQGLQVGAGGSIFARKDAGETKMFIAENVKWTSDGFEYINNGPAAYHQMDAGTHGFYVAPSGTADAVIDATGSISIANSGNVGIGTTSPEADLSFEPVVYTSGFAGIKFQEASVTTDAVLQAARLTSNQGIAHFIGANCFVDTDGGIDRFNTSEQASFIQVDPRGQIYFGAGDNSADPSATMVLEENGRLGIGTTSPAAPFHVIGSTMLIADGESDNAIKQGRIGSQHYDTDEEPFYYLYSIIQSGNNQINIGGGTSAGNAATNIQFYTAANSSTVTGTKLFELTGNKISGSSTSTGSFGVLTIGETGGTGNAQAGAQSLVAENGITVYNTGTGRLNFSDGAGGGDSAYKGVIKYNHSTNILTFAANSVDRVSLNADGVLQTLHVSGSSISTGSFGRVHIGSQTAGASPYTSTALSFAPANHPTRIWSLNYDDGGSVGAGFNISYNNSRLFYLNGGNGRVGLGTASPKTHLDVQSYQADGITIGADNDANKTRTNSTVKSGGITGVHYTNAEESIRIIGYDSTSDANKVYIGGANGDWNAATQIDFYTAANFNTTAGTKTLEIHPNKISGSARSTGSFGAIAVGLDYADLYQGAKSIYTKGYIDINGNGGLSFNDNTSTGYFYASNVATISSGNNIQFKTYPGSGAYRERMRIDNSGHIGIGHPTPLYELHVSSSQGGTTPMVFVEGDVSGSSSSTGSFGKINASDGMLVGKHSAGTFGADAAVFPLHVLQTDTDDTAAILVQNSNTGDAGMLFNISGQSFIMGIDASATGDPFVIADSSALGTTNRLSIASDGVISGDFNDTSDIALKENIFEISSSYEKVKQLNPVTFNWKEEEEKGTDEQIGFIAQEVEKVYPQLVEGEEGNKSVNVVGLVSVLTKTVQELSEKVEELERNSK